MIALLHLFPPKVIVFVWVVIVEKKGYVSGTTNEEEELCIFTGEFTARVNSTSVKALSRQQLLLRLWVVGLVV